jgi:DNA replication protein DnaC
MSDLAFTGLGDLLKTLQGQPTAVAQAIASLDEPEPVDPGAAAEPWSPDERRCCRGSGFVRLDVPANHADFGRLIECPCGLILARRAARLWGQTQIPEDYAAWTLDTYPAADVADKVRAWYAGARKPWLLLHGEHGGGKTTLAVSLVKQAVADGISAVFRVTPDLMDEIRRTYDPSTQEAAGDGVDLLGALKGVQLLVLDDVGAERMTGWVEEKLFQLLNYRHNEHRRTVLTTNLAPDDLMDHVGERIFWRIKAMASQLTITGNLRMGRP